jgi:regulator of protease activity HflC (stomatin/prohibitin superfamily)
LACPAAQRGTATSAASGCLRVRRWNGNAERGTHAWLTRIGVRAQALRYEIRDIQVPQKIKDAMDQQAEAERRKRAHVLDSEAEQLSDINIAEGRKRAQVLASEADYQERVNRARGEAEAVVLLADATAASIKKVTRLPPPVSFFLLQGLAAPALSGQPPSSGGC